MMANEQRLVMILEANDKATAQLRLIRKEIETVRGATDGSSRSTYMAAQNTDRLGENARKSARAMSSIAFAAQSATLGTRGVVMAAGNLAEAAALGSSRMALFAPHIAAAVIVAGTLLTLFQRMNREAAGISDASKTMLASFDDRQIDTVFQRARERREAATIAAANSKPKSAQEVVEGTPEQKALQAAIEWEVEVGKRRRDVRLANVRRERDEAEQEADRRGKEQLDLIREHETARAKLLFDLRNQSAVTWAQARGNEAGAERIRIEQEHAARMRQIAELTTVSQSGRDELGVDSTSIRDAQIYAIAERNRRRTTEARNDMLAGSEDPREAFAGRMAQIAAERDAQIKAGLDVATATEISERKIRALRLDTARSAIGYLKTIEDATMSSSKGQIRAIGMLANVIRRLHIGAEASLAAVESARAFGKVPGYLASHQYGSAALSGLAGLKLAAAAALGFRESLGGGGGGAGSGGGGGSATEASRFEPSAASAGVGSGVTINLITRDPYGRESIQQTMFVLERAGVLKTPAIQIPPTPGLVAA